MGAAGVAFWVPEFDGGGIAGPPGSLPWRTHAPHMQESQCYRDCIASLISPGECFLYSTARQPNKARGEVPILPLRLDPAGWALKQTQT